MTFGETILKPTSMRKYFVFTWKIHKYGYFHPYSAWLGPSIVLKHAFFLKLMLGFQTYPK